jgi:hypothetical protein
LMGVVHGAGNGRKQPSGFLWTVAADVRRL